MKRNKNYRESERRILCAIVKLCRKAGLFRLVVREVAREAGVATATVYNHYDGVVGLVKKKRRGLAKEVGKMMKKGRGEVSMERRFQDLLLACYRERETVDVLFTACSLESMAKMMGWMTPILKENWGRYTGREDEICDYCRWLILEEIRVWQREKYDVGQIERHSKHMAWMVKNAPRYYFGMVAGDKENK